MNTVVATHNLVRQRVASLRLTGKLPTGLCSVIVAAILRARQAPDASAGKMTLEPGVREPAQHWTADALAARMRVKSEEIVVDAAYRWWTWIRSMTAPPAEPTTTVDPSSFLPFPVPASADGAIKPVLPALLLDKVQYIATGMMLQQLLLPAMGVPGISISAASDRMDWDAAWAADLKLCNSSPLVFDDRTYIAALCTVLELCCGHEHPFKWASMLCTLLDGAQADEGALWEAVWGRAQEAASGVPAPPAVTATPEPLVLSPAAPASPERPTSSSAAPSAVPATGGVQWAGGLQPHPPSDGPRLMGSGLSFKPRQSIKRVQSTKDRPAFVAGRTSQDHGLQASLSGGLALVGSKSTKNIQFEHEAVSGPTGGASDGPQPGRVGAGTLGMLTGHRAPLQPSRSMAARQAGAIALQGLGRTSEGGGMAPSGTRAPVTAAGRQMRSSADSVLTSVTKATGNISSPQGVHLPLIRGSDKGPTSSAAKANGINKQPAPSVVSRLRAGPVMPGRGAAGRAVGRDVVPGGRNSKASKA